MKKSFFGVAPKIFNKIPDAIKCMPLKKFKKCLHKLLVEKCYYALDDYFNDNTI